MSLDFSRIDELLALEPGWDSYGAPAIDPADVEATRFLLSLLPADWRDSAQIVPTSEGGVTVEWHREGRGIEVHAYGALPPRELRAERLAALLATLNVSVATVGEGLDGALVVYLETQASVLHLPSSFEGTPVHYVVSGKIRPGGS